MQPSQVDFYSGKVLTMAQEGEGDMAEGFKKLASSFLSQWDKNLYPDAADLHEEVSKLLAISAPGQRPSAIAPVSDKVEVLQEALEDEESVTYKSLKSFPHGRLHTQ